MSAAETAISNMADADGLPLKPPEGTKACPGGRVRIGVFFDGTGNNRYVDEPNGTKPGYQSPDTNGPTNVVKLWRLYQEKPPLLAKIYHHGVGTDSETPKGVTDVAPAHSDSAGGGFGVGGKERVEWAVKKLSDFYSQNSNYLAIEKLFDTYGFSRGAAIARDFVNVVLTQGLDNHMEPNGVKFEEVGGIFGTRVDMIKSYQRHRGVVPIFLGIFDTVGSFGIEGLANDQYNFFVDHTRVRRCVHMMAEDEHRHFFPVSSCFMDPKDTSPGWVRRQFGATPYQDPSLFAKGAGGNLGEDKMQKGALVEIWYPGAHSDVGGGYLLRAPVAAIPGETIYTDGGFPITFPDTPAVPEKRPQLSFIPLRDMHKASKKSQVPLDPLESLAAALWQVPGDLESHYGAYDGYREGKKYKIHKGSEGIYIQSLPEKEFESNFDTRATQPDLAYIIANYAHDSSAEFKVAGVHTAPIDGKQRGVLYMGPQPKDP